MSGKTVCRATRMAGLTVCGLAALLFSQSATDLVSARDRGDNAALDALIKQTEQSSDKGPTGQYRIALAYSYAAEVAMEQHDKRKSQTLAESGLGPAKKAAEGAPNDAEYHRLVGALCGQVIPANPLMGTLKYGQCARDEITKAIELNPKLALAYVTRGVGNYYLPSSMGGGLEIALKDFDKAISLDSKLADAYLWKGITLRKANQNGEARKALEEAVRLAPNRAWAKEQLQKTPAS